MIEISLCVPQIVELLYARYKRGADIPYNVISLDEAVKIIAKWRKSLGNRDKLRTIPAS